MKQSCFLPFATIRLAGFLLLAVSSSPAFGSTAESSNITVDTRSLSLTGLTISGPSTVSVGSEAAYTATLSYEGAAPEDVTDECAWTVTGGPVVTNVLELPSINYGVLHPRVASPVPLQVTARVIKNGGAITSAPFSVVATAGNGLLVGIKQNTGGGYVGPAGGGGYEWNFGFEAFGLALSEPGVTLSWFLDGVAKGSGVTLDLDITGQPGTRQLRVLADDGAGRTGESYRTVVLNQPAANERGRLIPVENDPKGGELLDSSGGAFEFAQARIPNGLIILTHGVRSSGEMPWIKAMANAIFTRLDDLGKPIPNIAILDWEELARPSRRYGDEAGDEEFLSGTIGTSSSVIAKASKSAADFLFDLVLVRPNGGNVGVGLSTWIQKEIGNGNINPAAPIHLIGHSAGGFVVGECALKIKQSSGLNVARITMLDTPHPYGKHHSQLPNPGVVERYVSSFAGVFAPKIDGATMVRFERLRVSVVPLSPKPNTSFYSVQNVQNTDTYPWNLIRDHRYSYEWYTDTIRGDVQGTGFAKSPFITGSGVPTGAPPIGPSPIRQPPVPLTGFLSFGTVTGSGSPFVLTEDGNCGIYLTSTLPVDADAVSFRYRFTNVGDGDYLVGTFGDSPALFVASGDAVEAGEWLEAEIPLAPFAGKTGDLVIKLIARGAANAVVEIDQLAMITDPDIDGDGILAVDELAAGSSPLLADTDGDGLSDAYEIHTSLTNPAVADTDGDGGLDGAELAAGTDPNDPLSRFAVERAAFSETGFGVEWSAVTGKIYRVLRSPTPGFESYEVIASGLPAVVPETLYDDGEVDPEVDPKMFYKVEVEE